MLAGRKAALPSAAFLLLLAGCTGDGVNRLRLATDAQARAAGFAPAWADVAPGPLYTAVRRRDEALPVRVATLYIEGDGAPWPSAYRPPLDPTPVEPTVLQMALADPGPITVYVGRPCQYLDATARDACDPALRDEARFSPAVIDAYDALLDRLKPALGVQQWRLVGYSGGGVIAALLAARRSDLAAWATVAAPLDLARWTRDTGLSPLTASLDPMNVAPRLAGVHWLGARDRLVPPEVVQGYVRRHGGTVHVVSGYDHVCCWARAWAARAKEITP